MDNEQSKEMIFTEDLKNMLFLMENTPEDLQLFRKMLTRSVVIDLGERDEIIYQFSFLSISSDMPNKAVKFDLVRSSLAV